MEGQINNGLLLQTKAFITDLLIGVNSEDSIEHIIRYIMKEVGCFTRAERICIYESGVEGNRVEETYQWNAEHLDGLDAEVRYIQQEQSEIHSWIHLLKMDQVIAIQDRESIRESMPIEYAQMKDRGIHSFMLIPLSVKDNLPECISIINPDFTAFSMLESVWLFLGKQIGLLYHRERMNHKYLFFMEGIRSSNLSEFVVDCKTMRYEAFRITKKLKGVIPDEGDWNWLRQFYSTIIKPEYRDDLMRRTQKEYLESFLCTEQGTFAMDIEREDQQGNNYWFRLEFSAVSVSREGDLERFVLLVKDITQMKQEEEEHRQMIQALSSIYKAVYMINLTDKMVLPINCSEVISEHLSGDSMFHKDILNIYCQYMVGEEYEESIREFLDIDTMEERFQNSNMLTCEYHRKQIGWGRIILVPSERNKDGSIEKIVFAVQDITEQKQREAWMQYKIEHDELTGTLNRSAFNRVTRLMEENDSPYALVLLDIDKFKSINDTYGHAVGDDVLIALVSVLNEKMRLIDRIFRLGGDEFAIIMNKLTLSQADIVKQILEDVNVITTKGINNLPSFSVSAGVAFSQGRYDEGLYQNADKALYRRKDTTRRGSTIYEEMEADED